MQGNVPLDVSIELTHHCNFCCQHCYIPDFLTPDRLPTKRVFTLLVEISAATIDRLLAPERMKLQLRGRSGTKPGTLLKSQIPLKRFGAWREDESGFLEVDLVAHEGGRARGDYLQTLEVTDIGTGWTEMRAVKNKAQVWVLEAMKVLQDRCPGEIRIMPCLSLRIRMPSPRQMIVPPIPRFRGSFPWSMATTTITFEF